MSFNAPPEGTWTVSSSGRPRVDPTLIMSGTAASARTGSGGASCSSAARTDSCCTIRLRRTFLEREREKLKSVRVLIFTLFEIYFVCALPVLF